MLDLTNMEGIHQADDTLELVVERWKERVGGIEVERKALRGVMPRNSLLWHCYNDLPWKFQNENGRWSTIPNKFNVPIALRPNVYSGETESVLPIGLDQGNGYMKIALFDEQHIMRAINVPNRVEVKGVNTTVRFGTATGGREWRVGDETKIDPERFRVGDDCIGGRGFPSSNTPTKFNDAAYIPFVKINLVQALRNAGYLPGEHRVSLGIAIRLSEMQIDENTGSEVYDPAMIRAISRLKGKFVVQEIDGANTHEWKITISSIYPLVQGVGTAILWIYNVLFDMSQNKYRSINVMDWGTNDAGHVETRIYPGRPLRSSGFVFANGMGVVADAIKETLGMLDPKMEKYTVEEAQQAIISNVLVVNGQQQRLIGSLADAEGYKENPTAMPKNLKIAASVEKSYKEALNQLLVSGTNYLKKTGLFLINTGGSMKNATFNEMLHERVIDLQHYYGDEGCALSDVDCLDVPSSIASVSNAMGTCAYVTLMLMRLANKQVAK